MASEVTVKISSGAVPSNPSGPPGSTAVPNMVSIRISVANTLASAGLPVAVGAASLLNEVLWS